MFSAKDGFPYRYRTTIKQYDGPLEYKRHIYTFKSRKKHSYILYADFYPEINTCAVKFFLKSNRLSDKKYQIESKLFEMPGVLSTCINIMVELYQKNPLYSFGFIGSNSENENKNNTKRFRVYKAIMMRTFSPTKFNHLEYIEKSAYLMLNRENEKDKPSIQQNIEDFFSKYYVI